MGGATGGVRWSHHDFRRDEVFSFTGQTLHLSLLLPVHRVINTSFIQGSTGGLEVSTWNTAEGSSEEEEEEEEHQPSPSSSEDDTEKICDGRHGEETGGRAPILDRYAHR